MANLSLVLSCIILVIAGTLGQDYGTNYNAGDHGRSESVSPDGEVQGQYQYTDPDGKLITVKYRAGKDGFQVEGDHLPRAPQPGGPTQQQQQQPSQFQQPFFNSQQFQQQPQQYQQYQSQPQQTSFFNQPFFNQQQQQQPQVQSQPQQSSFFQNFGQNQFQNHPNALPGQYQPQQQSQFFGGQQQPGQNNRPTKVTVNQQPGAGFSYSLET